MFIKKSAPTQRLNLSGLKIAAFEVRFYSSLFIRRARLGAFPGTKIRLWRAALI
jgi:hypothetical protein